MALSDEMLGFELGKYANGEVGCYLRMMVTQLGRAGVRGGWVCYAEDRESRAWSRG
jgi:hypothetical protein